MKITDSVTLGDTRVNDAGYLEANARTARVGIQQYLGAELGRPDLHVVNVYRDEAEVFSKRSLDTFSKIPVTLDHPDGPVTAETWKDVAVGTTGDDVLRDGEYLKIGLKITDAEAVRAIQSGKRELSVGYSTNIIWEDGVSSDGTPYQARQTAIVANHIAIVGHGRAGSKARIGDGAWGASPFIEDQPGLAPITKETVKMTDVLKTVVLGDKAVQVAVSDVAAIEQFKADSAKVLVDVKAAHEAAIAAKDEEIGKLKADLKTAQDAAKIDVDKLVADRAQLVEAVKAIDAKIETGGKSDADLRKAAVASKLGDEMVSDASDAEILGMFKAVAKDAKTTDPVADAIRAGIKPSITDAASQAQTAWDKSITDLNAWRKEA